MRGRILTLLTVSWVILNAYSLSLTKESHAADDNLIVGGFSRPTMISDENTITGDLKEFNQFVRLNVPQVQGKQLLSYKEQVVSGVNYCCDYGHRTPQTVTDITEVCLWSRPWKQGFLQLTSPDGRKISVNREEIRWPIKYNWKWLKKTIKFVHDTYENIYGAYITSLYIL